MISIGKRVLFTVTLAAASAVAQSSDLTGPVSGLLVDEQSRSIRPIIGMPGSAYAGDVAVSQFEFASAAPDGRNAVITRDGALYLIRRLDGSMPVWRQLASEAANVARVAWSENSEAVALLNSDAQRLDLWTNLSLEPKLSASLDLAAVHERIVALAVDKDAKFAFAATQGEDAGTLYFLQPGQEPRMVMPLGRAGGLLLSSDALYVTDRGRNEVLQVTNWAFNPAITSVASAGHGVNDPVGVALSPDRKILYVASAGTRQVLAMELGSSAVKGAVDLDFEPTRLERLGSGSLFLLEKGVPGELPAQVLDSAAQKVYFVPVSAAAGE